MPSETPEPRAHRDAVAQEVTAALGLDGTNDWLAHGLVQNAIWGVEQVFYPLDKAIGAEASARVSRVILESNRPEFRKAGILTSTSEAVVAISDLWLNPFASVSARMLADETVVLAIAVNPVTHAAVLCADIGRWAARSAELLEILGVSDAVSGNMRHAEPSASTATGAAHMGAFAASAHAVSLPDR